MARRKRQRRAQQQQHETTNNDDQTLTRIDQNAHPHTLSTHKSDMHEEEQQDNFHTIVHTDEPSEDDEEQQLNRSRKRRRVETEREVVQVEEYNVDNGSSNNKIDTTAAGYDPNVVTPSVEKFFAMRYRLWSRFDEGIEMDETAYYSVTPEKIAVHIAKRICEDVAVVVDNNESNRSNSSSSTSRRRKLLIIDGFAGVAGNAIQFALQPNCVKVIAIELDQQRIKMAEHNANVYGAHEKIEFICGDFLQVLHKLPWTISKMRSEDPELEVVVFLAPPYGGTHATLTDEYDMNEMAPTDACTLIRLCASYLSPHICFLLPKNITHKQLGEMIEASETDTAEYEENMLSGRCKTVSLYLGNLLVRPDLCSNTVQLPELLNGSGK